MAAGIIIDRFSYRYSQSAPPALAELSLSVAPGSCCAVVGPTGAGKSTLLHALSGILGKHHSEGIASGELRIGTEIHAPLPRRILFPQVGLALQDPHVQISGVRETVHDELAFTLENLGLLSRAHGERIPDLLRELGIDHLADRNPTRLSGGETQRVALATILVARPEILLLDEPSTALDSSGKERLKRILLGLKETTTVLVTDTYLDLALSVADHVAVLDRGTVLFTGTPAELLGRIDDFATVLPCAGWSKVMASAASIAHQPEHPANRLLRRLGIP